MTREDQPTGDDSSITLTPEGGEWIATHEATDTEARGRSRRDALEALDDALLRADSTELPKGDPVSEAPVPGEPTVDEAPVGILRLDHELRLTAANPRARERLGLESGLEDGEAPELVSVLPDACSETVDHLSDGEAIEFECSLEPDSKTKVDVLGRGVPVTENEQFQGAVVTLTDVTELRNRERELQEEANLLQQIFSQVPVSLYVKDTEGRHVRISHYDSDPAEAIGKTDLDLYGEEFGRKTYDDDMHVIETGESIVNAEEYNPDNGIWTLTSKVPWYGKDGEIQGLIGVTRFITERKEYEEALKREKERFERLANVVAHDLRNPLNVAAGHVQLLEEAYDHESIERVSSALDRMDELIEDALTLARHGEAIEEVETLSLTSVVDRVSATMSIDGADLRVDDGLVFYGDESRVVQLFENLVRNALEHGLDGDPTEGERDEVRIRVGPLEDGEGFYVEDDGPGIPEARRDAVFETGFTTAEDGTGFGLSIVQEIVDAHGWDVHVTDGRSGGARFEITEVETDP